MTTLACQSLDVSIAGKNICSGLNLTLEPGQFWGLLGPNGIGKTTLLKCMAGLAVPDRGSVLLENQPIDKLPRRLVARLLGMLQQHTVYIFDATVLETAMTGRHPHLAYWEREGSEDRQKTLDAIRAVDLVGFENRSVTGLSGGEARRLAPRQGLQQSQGPACVLISRLAERFFRPALIFSHRVENADLPGFARSRPGTGKVFRGSHGSAIDLPVRPASRRRRTA